MTGLLHDLRYAVRGLRRQPGFAILVVAILAIAIGANTATFTVVYSTLLRPLPYDDPERIVMVWETSATRDRDTVTSANVYDWRARNQSFEELAAFDTYPVTMSGRGDAERFFAGAVTEGFFTVLRAKLSHGRFFETGELEPGADDVVILHDRVWRSRFGADPAVIGETVRLDGRQRTIIGVLAPEFRSFRRDASFWIPLALDAESRADRRWHWIHVVARLEQGVSIEGAQADMDAVVARLTEEDPQFMTGRGARVVGLRQDVMSESRRALLLLMGAVGLLLIVASANVASLMVARGAARRGELALRTALGAGRLRLVRGLLVESLLLGAIGGALGLALGWLGVSITLAALPIDLPRQADVSLDGRVVAFTLLVVLATSVVFGVLPARQALKRQVSAHLAERARHGTSVDRARTQRALVVAEVAISLVLLVGSGLLLGSLWRILRVDPGFDPQGKLAMILILPLAEYPTVEDQTGFFERLMDSVATLPGVRAVDSATALPLLGPQAGRSQVLFVEGRPLPPVGEVPSGPHQRFVTPGFFRTMGIRLLRGRTFEERDGEAPGLLVINEALAEELFPGEDPIGQRVSLERGEPPSREIIGIVSSTKEGRLDEPAGPAIYAPPRQRLHPSISWAFIVVATDGEPTSVIQPLRAAVREEDPNLSIFQISTLEEVVADATVERRVSLVVLGFFAAASLLLAAVGVYSVLHYDVSQRRREIGVRMALGANRRNVSNLIIGGGMRTVATGLLIGGALSFLLTRLVSGLLFGVSPTDPITLAAACLVLTTAALVACAGPAYRATRISPAESMRYE